MTQPGAAREVPAGRLAAFEDADDEQPTPLLPPRRTTPSAPNPRTPASGPDLDPGPAAARQPLNRIRPSNVHVPVQLLERLEQQCEATGLSRGELIIVAIEATQSSLPGLIQPAARAGGSLFAARSSKVVHRPTKGPVSPLHYRLREDDFATLDDLVTQFGATSRGHLITAALTAYLDSLHR